MSLLVTGSIGIDTVKTPFGLSENCLGGSAVYFSLAASFFCPVRFLGVIGGDCPFDLHQVFQDRDIDLAGLEIRPNSKTFRWSGSYAGAMDDANTDAVELNVLAEAPPTMPSSYKNSRFVFLANTHPALQMQLLEQLDNPALVVADTMNLWIENEPDALRRLLQRIDALVLNENEARMFTQQDDLAAAAAQIVKLGLQFVVVKKGSAGTLLHTADQSCFTLPAYPTTAVKDPTGAGDTFAGGMMGFLAARSAAPAQLDTLKQAVAYGTATASLVIEDFSLNRWNHASRTDIDTRFNQLPTAPS